MGYFARVLADSMSPAGVRITTLEATFPRFILAEMNTYRVFSRNSASSRAIPPEKLIEKIMQEPFVPETFGKRVKGMGVGEDIDDQDRARNAWEWHRKCSIQAAHMLLELDCDKSRINRLLEPHMWHTAIITSTEWENFFGLRAPDGDTWDRSFPAQPEMQIIAIAMRNAIWSSMSEQLQEDWWHLPGSHESERMLLCDYRTHGTADQVDSYLSGLRDVCSRRLARISFDKSVDEHEEWSISISKSGELKVGGHFSPFEHIARPLTLEDNYHVTPGEYGEHIMVPLNAVYSDGHADPQDMWSGNLRGWLQYRKLMPNESNFMEVRNARFNRSQQPAA